MIYITHYELLIIYNIKDLKFLYLIKKLCKDAYNIYKLYNCKSIFSAKLLYNYFDFLGLDSLYILDDIKYHNMYINDYLYIIIDYLDIYNRHISSSHLLNTKEIIAAKNNDKFNSIHNVRKLIKKYPNTALQNNWHYMLRSLNNNISKNRYHYLF